LLGKQKIDGAKGKRANRLRIFLTKDDENGPGVVTCHRGRKVTP